MNTYNILALSNMEYNFIYFEGEQLMMNKKFELGTKLCWEFDMSKKIGHIRAHFNDGRLSSHWVSGLNNLSDKEWGEIGLISDEVFKIITCLNKVIELCEGSNLATGEANYYCQSENLNFWIRLNPQKGEHQVYVHAYKK